MPSYSAFVAVVLTLLPVVAARGGRGRGGGGGVLGNSFSHLDAPPLQIANLIAYAVFLLVAIIQLEIARRALSRPGARLPAAGAIAALTLQVVGYALYVALVTITYTVDDDGLPPVHGISYIRIQTASPLLYTLADPAIFVAMALLLYNRYRTVQKSFSAGFIACASIAGALLILMVALLGAELGLYSTALTARFVGIMSPAEEADSFKKADNVHYAYVAFHVLGSFFMAAYAFLVKARTKDQVTLLALIGIIPLLVLHAFALVIFAILLARLPLTGLYAVDTIDALDFASTLVYGMLYLGAMSVFVFLLHHARMPTPPSTAPAAPPQFAPQYLSAPGQMQPPVSEKTGELPDYPYPHPAYPAAPTRDSQA